MPEHPPRFVSFLSDYGQADEFAGVCRAVMLGLAPELTIVDITHDIPAHDIRAGALALVRSVQYLPDGIVLAVVDPGVGTDRRAIAVETDSGYFLGPDNGLLAPAVAMIGGAGRAVSLTNEEFHLASPGPTFAGRDIFAPVAGYLAAGIPFDALGEAIDPIGMVPGLVSLPTEEDGAIVGEVWWVDRFGNCQLNIDPAELQLLGVEVGGSLELRFGGQARMARWVATYADAKPSELVMLVDSYGLVSLALDRRSAAEELGLHGGSGITVVPPPSGGSR
ncbi:MAG: SAM hydrolase/SAM-dependent halogenase family protein [Acidimicrobiia bacterium]